MTNFVHRVRARVSSPSERTSRGDIELGNSPKQPATSTSPAAPKYEYLRGYPSLSTFISSNPQSESFIFKRFDKLAARNLLYLQSELACLQEKLEDFDKEDYKPPYDREANACARSWEDFERVKDSNERQKERWDLMLRTRSCLREYQETLLLQSRTAALSTPSKDVLEAFQAEFVGHGSSLIGASKTIYDSNDDLVQLHSTERKDRVSTFLAKYLFRWLHTNAPNQNHADPRITYVYTSRLDLFVELFYAVLSIVLLLGAILSLYFIKNAIWRITTIALFTLVFAACAIFLADGRRLAVFGACAAYAAVLVVFVSSENVSGGRS
ncbi:uncharacterized protein K460DRAFT_271456 [Cucurbitaria berberidis CBS 394.84]|uniref:DUF6594 domain-containing protein n=1 Tax=Cucurbitaria berberidis CBS 394.84 TaxID=1168544 RepID=A0A9P4GSE4_9PLEO|nr:uncharacterized protein K460DRAFT_271456 [Cucurbitaria berberidis CBS 394.84]KAF1850467.1 hypothetical protein K460DRAFT_271456 [Cucurbitaria berberidis CBS 394.84]